ncbi:MAG: VOC family protein [Armatimonadota bacterium]
MSNQVQPDKIFNDLVQIGVVVNDLDKSVETLSEVFGLGPFHVTDWPPPDRGDLYREYHGEQGEFTARIAFTQIGSTELEIIQPLEGPSLWADFLQRHGPGIHHIRFNIVEMEPVLEYLSGKDINVSQRGEGLRPGTSWAYLDTEKLVGFDIEVLKKVIGTDGRTPIPTDIK